MEKIPNYLKNIIERLDKIIKDYKDIGENEYSSILYGLNIARNIIKQETKL